VEQTLAHGGLISNKQNPDGTRTPYEMNINYFDALSDPHSDEAPDLQVARFMAAQAIMLTLQGVPGIYFHSLLGSRNWPEGVQQSGSSRAINRQKLTCAELETALADPSSLRAQVFIQYSALLHRRAGSPAFHPQGTQKVLDVGRGVFGMQRTSPDGTHRMLCLQNVTDRPQNAADYTLQPYQGLWLEM
ncbi:MAG: sugar phosphorylase, partial [Chloroflexi bacterium]|nr:sugar phosphorylase [Chloroflexota bacterium]